VDESDLPQESLDRANRILEFEERFRARSAHSSDPISEVGQDLRLIYVSPAFTRTFGYEPSEVLGKNAMLHVHPDDSAAVLSIHAQTTTREPVTPLRFRYRHKNGSWRWVDLTGCPYRSASGEYRAILINRDVTDHVEAQRELREQLVSERRIDELSRYFLTVGSDDFENGLDHGLEAAATLAGADRVQFFVLDSGSVGKCYQWNAEGIEEREWEYSDEMVAQWRWSGAQLMRGDSIVVRCVADMPSEAAPERESLIDAEVKSYLAIPVVHRGETIGFLDFLCMRSERNWSDQEVSRLRLLTDVFASALRRHRAEVSRLETEQRFRALAERTSDSICEVAANGSILFASASFDALLGYTLDELNTMDPIALIHPEDRRAIQTDMTGRLVAENKAPTLQLRARHRDESWRWIEATARSFDGPNGESRYAVVLRDVTQRRRAQDDLEQQLILERRLTRLSSEFLDRGADEIDAGIQHALGVVGDLAGTDRCWLIAWGMEEQTELQTFEWQAEGVLPRPFETGLPDRRQQAWVFRQLACGEPVLVRRAADLPDEAAAVRDSMVATGIQSFLAVPIRSEETLVGVLGFHSLRQEKHWTEREVNLFRLVAGIFTSALRRKRSEADLRESESRFRALAEHAQDPICEVDQDGGVLYASPSFTDLLGYSRQEIAALNLFSIIHPEDFASIREEFTNESPDGRSPGTLLYRARHKSGKWIVLEGTAEIFHSASGEVRIVAVIRDVTEQRRAQQALERQLDLETRIAVLSRRFLAVGPAEIDQTIRESLADLAALADSDRSWLYWFDRRNDKLLDFFEWHSANIPPRAQSLIAEDPGRFPWSADRLKKGYVVHFPDTEDIQPEARLEQERLREHGVRSFLSIPLHSGGDTVGFLGFETVENQKTWTNEIITLLRLVGEIFVTALQRKDVEEDLRESQQQLMQAQKMEAVGTLAGGIAHDFNNQLTVMLGNARFVMRHVADEPELKDALTDLNRAAEHCAQLTRSLLAFSRRSAVSPRSLDVRGVVKQVDELLRPLIPNSVEFNLTIPNEVGCVDADPTQLQQVLVNLAINARDAMPDGGTLELAADSRWVDADTAARMGLPAPGEYVEIGVMDTGHGIDEGTQKRIFEPFFTTKPLGKGTGLGLATAYGIVTECRGAILVDSVVDVGTKFRVLLPRSEDTEQAEELADMTPETTRSGTVLVVEDERSVRRFIRSTLERNDFNVHQAANGADALRLAKANQDQIDIVVTDVNMPEMDGFELARALTGILPDVPVLFLSGSERPAAMGPDAVQEFDWLQKPFGEEEIVDWLRRILMREQSKKRETPRT
jgi:PAS domain S-box-containing protein